MSVFGTVTPRRLKAGSPWGEEEDSDVAALAALAPDVEAALDAIDNAVQKADRVKDERERSCSCW